MWKDDPGQLCHTGHMWLLAISNNNSNSNIALRRTKVQSVTHCVHCTVLYTTVNTQTTQYTEAAGSQSIPHLPGVAQMPGVGIPILEANNEDNDMIVSS